MWDEPPAKLDVEHELQNFFQLLRRGELAAAEAAIGHAHDDWNSQIWSLWQDTYLIYLEELDEEVEDDSFEGEAWRRDLTWLEDIGIDEVVHWDGEGDTVNAEGEHLFVNVTYKGELYDVSGNFSVVAEQGRYHLVRESIRMM